MSVPFSNLNVTVDYDATSVNDFQEQTKDALVAANWSSAVSGTGYNITSATTPQGLNVVLELRITAGTLTALFRSTSTMTVAYQQALVLVINPQPMRIVASPYQFFTFRQGVVAGGSRVELMGGVPFIPTFLEASTSEAWWSVISSNRTSFRETVNPLGEMAGAINGSLMEATANDTAYDGRLSIIPPRSVAGATPADLQWYDGSALDAECLVAWGSSRDVIKRSPGLIWDMVCIWDQMTIDDDQTFGGKTWTNISSSTMTPSLWVVKE